MKLAIWGSCATRDVLEAGSHPFAVDYHARTSWVSQASGRGQALGAVPVPIPAGPGFGERMVREDLTKEVVSGLVATQPEILVLDLIDERFDVVEIDGGWFTMSDYYERLGLEPAMREAAKDTSVYRTSARAVHFGAAAARLAPQLSSALPDTRIVLHQAWYTARTADPSVPFYATATKHAMSSNAALASWYSILRSAFGRRLHVIEPPRDFLVGDSGHRWGLAHYHYIPDYYEWMLSATIGIAEGNVGPRWTARRPPRRAPRPRFVAA